MAQIHTIRRPQNMRIYKITPKSEFKSILRTGKLPDVLSPLPLFDKITTVVSMRAQHRQFLKHMSPRPPEPAPAPRREEGGFQIEPVQKLESLARDKDEVGFHYQPAQADNGNEFLQFMKIVRLTNAKTVRIPIEREGFVYVDQFARSEYLRRVNNPTVLVPEDAKFRTLAGKGKKGKGQQNQQGGNQNQQGKKKGGMPSFK